MAAALDFETNPVSKNFQLIVIAKDAAVASITDGILITK